jgi:hypothetical protein
MKNSLFCKEEMFYSPVLQKMLMMLD